ncbi:MAG: DinB family protein [Acidobacteriia bacterium]|nr:DinB family protein [Terriglobia bacterium]
MQTAGTIQFQNVISFLEKTPQVLKTLLAGTAEETLSWKPAPDRWSIAEVLAHLAAIETLYGQRAQRMATEDAPFLQVYDPGNASAEGPYAQGDAEAHLAAFTEARQGTLALLSMLPPTAGERTAQHSELGRVTLSQMLHELASHDLGHLRQIAELYRALEFYPYAGPFQKYSHPKP